jgi:hypothetical protein
MALSKDTYKDVEPTINKDEVLRTGDRIIHKDFGEGIIISTDGTTVQILFHRDSSLRKFMASHTSIKKI